MPTTPLPDYFELLRQIAGVSGGGTFGPGSAAGVAFDPGEIEKKIRELQTVHVWLQVQANAVELSIKALEYQRDTLVAMQTAQGDAGQFGADDLQRFAAAFDPAQWMRGITPGSTGSAKAARPAKKSSVSKRNAKAAKKS